jgi:DeoR family ulaG and ulaABCDEF operon transcriptional repressor
MQPIEREQEIIRVLGQRSGFLPFEEIERLVQASSATLRRDLQRMAREGRIKRIRGGAKLVVQNRVANAIPNKLVGVPFRDNISRRRKQKEAIGRTAASLCKMDSAIIIGAGTTTLQMCRHLQGLNLRVLTNSLHVVTALSFQTGTRVTIPGGTLFPEQNVILDRDSFIEDTRATFSQIFIGAAALSPQGVMQADSLVASVDRRLIKQAEQLILLADSSKFTGAGHIVCDFSDVDIVITDPDITLRDRAMLRDIGAHLIIAS